MLFISLASEIGLRGAAFGGSAALSPSPHSIFLWGQSIQGAKKSWILKYLLGAFIVDSLIVLTVGVFRHHLSRQTTHILGWIGIGFILHSILILFRTKDENVSASEPRASARCPLVLGMVFQVTNPNPYIFWSSIGISEIHPIFLLTFFTALNLGKYGLARLIQASPVSISPAKLARISAVLLLFACWHTGSKLL